MTKGPNPRQDPRGYVEAAVGGVTSPPWWAASEYALDGSASWSACVRPGAELMRWPAGTGLNRPLRNAVLYVGGQCFLYGPMWTASALRVNWAPTDPRWRAWEGTWIACSRDWFRALGRDHTPAGMLRKSLMLRAEEPVRLAEETEQAADLVREFVVGQGRRFQIRTIPRHGMKLARYEDPVREIDISYELPESELAPPARSLHIDAARRLIREAALARMRTPGPSSAGRNDVTRVARSNIARPRRPLV